MNYEDKLAKAFKMPQLLNIPFDCPVQIRTTTTNSQGAQLNVCERKNSIMSINKVSKPRSSIDNILAKNKCSSDAQCTNTLALERKMRRKFFFERICGNKTPDVNSNTPVRILSPKTDRFDIMSDEPKESLRTETEGSKRLAVNLLNNGVHGSTSTGDSSCLSIDMEIIENAKRSKKRFASLNIKKVKLTKNTNSRLEFVPLLSDCINRDHSNYEAKESEKKFENSKFVFDFTDLVDNFNQDNDKWVELDEDALKQVFSKGKY